MYAFSDFEYVYLAKTDFRWGAQQEHGRRRRHHPISSIAVGFIGFCMFLFQFCLKLLACPIPENNRIELNVNVLYYVSLYLSQWIQKSVKQTHNDEREVKKTQQNIAHVLPVGEFMFI